MKNRIKLLIYLFISSLNFNLILKKYGLVTGGTQGLSIILSTIINISPWIIILTINCLFFVISCFFLDRETTKGIIISTFIYPLFVKITSIININIANNIGLLVLISGVISGFTIGNILKLKYSTGGINILLLLLKKYYKIRESLSNLIINSIIILLGLSLFGLKKAILGIIIIAINSAMIKVITDCKSLSN